MFVSLPLSFQILTFTKITCLILVIFTFTTQNYQHAVFAVFIVSMVTPSVLLAFWQRRDYMDPKLSILHFINAGLIIFVCIIALMYISGLNYPGKYWFDLIILFLLLLAILAIKE